MTPAPAGGPEARRWCGCCAIALRCCSIPDTGRARGPGQPTSTPHWPNCDPSRRGATARTSSRSSASPMTRRRSAVGRKLMGRRTFSATVGVTGRIIRNAADGRRPSGLGARAGPAPAADGYRRLGDAGDDRGRGDHQGIGRHPGGGAAQQPAYRSRPGRWPSPSLTVPGGERLLGGAGRDVRAAQQRAVDRHPGGARGGRHGDRLPAGCRRHRTGRRRSRSSCGRCCRWWRSVRHSCRRSRRSSPARRRSR